MKCCRPSASLLSKSRWFCQYEHDLRVSRRKVHSNGLMEAVAAVAASRATTSNSLTVVKVCGNWAVVLGMQRQGFRSAGHLQDVSHRALGAAWPGMRLFFGAHCSRSPPLRRPLSTSEKFGDMFNSNWDEPRAQSLEQQRIG